MTYSHHQRDILTGYSSRIHEQRDVELSITNFNEGLDMGSEAQVENRKILIGLITHPNSAADSAAYKASLEYFERGFKEQNWDVAVMVSQNNLFNRRVTLVDIWKSKWANINLVQKWIYFVQRSYGEGFRNQSFRRILDFVKRIRIGFLFAFETTYKSQLKFSEKQKFKRNLNISLSHLEVMKQSRDSSVDLTLILEDDSLLRVDNLLLDEIVQFSKNNLSESIYPALLNLSESLPMSKLFVTNSMGQLPRFNFSKNIYLPKIMHHNTTCAVIYNQHYIESILSNWGDITQKFVKKGVPIDWVINALSLELPSNSLLTFHSTQNLIVQGSIHGKLIE